jgi:hypothetical protein
MLRSVIRVLYSKAFSIIGYVIFVILCIATVFVSAAESKAYNARPEQFDSLKDFEFDEGQYISCNQTPLKSPVYVYAYVAETVLIDGEVITQAPSFKQKYPKVYDYYALPCYDYNNDKRIIVVRVSDEKISANVFDVFYRRILGGEFMAADLEFAGEIAPLDEGIEGFALEALTEWGAVKDEREFDRFFLPVQLNVGSGQLPKKPDILTGSELTFLVIDLFIYILTSIIDFTRLILQEKGLIPDTENE